MDLISLHALGIEFYIGLGQFISDERLISKILQFLDSLLLFLVQLIVLLLKQFMLLRELTVFLLEMIQILLNLVFLAAEFLNNMLQDLNFEGIFLHLVQIHHRKLHGLHRRLSGLRDQYRWENTFEATVFD